MPDCHGIEYSRSGSNGGLFWTSSRLSKFGICSRSSASSQFSSIIRPGYRELSVMTMISRSIPSPFESGPWIFPKYSSWELVSSK